MKRLLVLAALAFGILFTAGARAQTVLPRAGWVANASSSSGGDVPSNVLDGSSSSRWTTGGNQTPGQWFTVDFGAAQTFSQVTLDVGGSSNDYARSYELYVSNDGYTWGAPVANGIGAAGAITIVFPAQTARFVGIVQTGSASNWWSISELNVYSGTVPTVPLTPSGWTATASVAGSSTPASYAIDGSSSTRFSTGTNQASGQWLKVDLGSPQLLAGLKMDSGGSTSDYARAYQIFVSSDGTSWGSAIASGTATASPILVPFAQVTARYVKVVQTGTASNWWSISELTMYTPGSATPTASVLPRNGWTATASVSSGSDVPAKALDDSSSTRWSTGTNQTNGQYFQLDMQTTWSITKITLDASGNSSDYPRGYQVFVSTDGTNWGSVVATGAGSSALTTITFPLQVARYIKIVETGTASNWWSIAELNVYGTAPALLLRGGWTATASPNSSNAQLGIDGKVETEWSTGTGQVNGQWLKVDMKAAQTFNEITLDVTCNPADYARGYQVFVSNDGSSWGSAVASGTGTSSMITAAFPTQTARYLKVVQTATASNYWGVAELNVINTNPTLCATPCVALDACHDVGTCNPSTGVCSNPPKSGTSCSDGNACNGAEMCNNGVCQAGTPLVTDDNNPCTVDSCDAVAGVQHVPGNAGTVCRGSVGDCDVAETCSGTSAACPADGFAPSTQTCRGSAGDCDVAEQCTGTSAACPADTLVPAGTTCRGAADECDVAEACTGTSAICPMDGFKNNGTACGDDGNPCTADVCGGTSASCQHPAGNAGMVCRGSAGDCDVAEACDGSSTACPPNGFAPPTQTCRGSAGDCDVAEQCTGSSAACPPNGFAPPTQTCRGSAGDCDVAEQCTGSSATCPPNGFAPPTQTCRGSAGECDLAEACTGTSATCPPNAFKSSGTACSDDGNLCTADVCGGSSASCQHPAGNAGTVCRGSAGDCDVAEACDGSSTACPPNGFAPPTQTCRGAAGDCDVAEQCTGSNAACPPDTVVAAGTVCRASAGECDVDEKCDGTSTACPVNGFAPSSTVCRSVAGDCDVAETCTGSGASCPANTFVPAGTVCRAAAGDCDVAEACSGTSATCPNNDFKQNGTTCNDGNSCTTSDVCSAGTCAGSGSCNSSVAATMEFSTSIIQPSMPVTVVADRPGVRPSDTVNLTMTATFDGVSVNADGRLDVANTGPSDYVIPGYSITAEYQSPVSHEWIAIAKRAFDSDGHQQQNSAELLDVDFRASQVVMYDYLSGTVTYLNTPGVTYAPGRMAGTRIIPGATAISDVSSTFVLPEDAVHLLADPTQASALRAVLRIDAGPGLPIGAELVTPISLPPSGDLTITDLSGWYYTSGGTSSGYLPLTPPTVASLPLGSSVTFTGSGTIAPLLPAAVAANQYGGYKGYLERLAQTTFDASASVSGSAPAFPYGSAYGSGQTPELPTLVPIVEPQMVSGSPSPQPLGYPLNFDVALANVGTDVATNVNLQDAQYVFSGSSYTLQILPAAITAPISVAAGTTPHASMVFDTTGTTETGFNSFGQVTWSDVVGNTYGPLQTAPWPVALGPARPLGTLTLVADSTAPAPVESTKSFTTTALDPHAAPVSAVTVHLTVTGVNPQVLSAQTDASGVAHFSYSGKAAGGDTLVASATITTAPTTSGSQDAFWTAPYGHCTSPDVPLDVALVIDTSSSMEGAPLVGAKAAAHGFLNTMDLTRDQLAVVSFGGVSTLNVGLTSDFGQASAGIDGVEPGGGFINPTNIGAGLSTALDELASARARSTATPIIVFVSDGGNSFGDPEPALVRLAASGIRTFAFGLGSSADFAMLQRIASSKNELFYVPTADELGWLYKNLQRDLCRNQAPLAYAGGDQGAYGVRLPESLTLHGEVHDDGPVELLTSQWSVVSGPGTVTFTDASSPTTTALFSDPGTYVLKLEASDGVNTGSDTATVTVDSEPSLTGATLVASLGTPGPLAVGTMASLVATLKDSGGQPIPRFPIQLTVTGANAGTSTQTTDANGVATFTYVGNKVGTDVLAAVALRSSPLPAAAVSLAWNAPEDQTVVTQGWIGAPIHQSEITGEAPITIAGGVTLTSGTVTYWPLNAPDQIHTLATSVSGGPGATIATLDTTTMANGPWVVKVDATNDSGVSQVSEASVTVSGEYKPGRVVVETTDMTIPVVGMPITVGRRYDSLEKDNIGDFGYGWSLMLGHPRLEVDPAHNVTITMPDNRRVTFYFQATSATNSVFFAWLYGPGYVPEAGTYGTLTADGCPLMVLNGGKLVCFLESSLDYAPTTYTYTDQFGRAYTMGASGELRSITDRQGNLLTFTPAGITSNTGVGVTFDRDTQGRITAVTSPALDLGNGKLVYQYAYDPDGNLQKVTQPDNYGTYQFTYDDHRLLTTKDPNGYPARTSTYDATSGRLATDKDALGNTTTYVYDLPSHKTTITNPDLGTVVQTFDDRGLLLKEVDPLGRTTEHTYDDNRNELTRKNALNEVTTFKYDGNGNQTSIKNQREEETTITYNAFSQPLTSTDPELHTTTITYDDRGLPTQFSDETGTLATFTSSEHGLPLTVTDADGKTAYLTYDGAGNLTSRTDRLGRLTQHVYDGVGRLTQDIDPRGGITKFYYHFLGKVSKKVVPTYVPGAESFGWSYDDVGNLVSEGSDQGRQTDYTYDELNHLIKARYPRFGTTVEYTRDFRGNPLTMKDESGRTTTYEYDRAGQLLKTTFPDQTYTSRTYDDLGRLKTATDERGNTTTYEYEPGCGCAERVTKVTDPLGRSTMTTYDKVGRRASVTDAANHTTSYEYDLRGHLTKTVYADNTSELDGYDLLGRRTSHTDQMQKVTQYGYDAEGQLTSVTDALTHVTGYAYDDAGNLASVTDANNHTTAYEYDYLNRKTKRTLPLGMFETFAYNMYGDATSHVDFRGKTTTQTYDFLGRLLTKVPDPSLGEPTITFTYNPAGTRATMADASGSTTYGYDQRDRILTKGTSAGTLTYTYDPAGNVATVRSSNVNGTSVDYSWDAANQLVSVTDNRAGGVTTSAYTATGRTSTLTQPSGVGAAYSYDPRDRVTSLAWARGATPAFGSWSYGFNPRGQRTSVTDVTGRQVVYGYDAVSRLESETITNDPQGASGNGEISYSLDSTGNRLTRTSTLAALGAQSFTYDANDQLTTDGYDANGNTANSDGHTYGYDFENRLVSKDGGAVRIVYDGDGNRVAKTVGGVTTKYLVDDLNPTGYLQVLEEVSGGAVQVAYTYGTTLASQTHQPGVAGQTSYFGYDAHGNVAFLTDATGAVTDTYDYDAWGNVVASTGSTPNSRLYEGEELDPDLGMINLRARYYGPGRGRFGTVDPFEPGSTRSPLALNRYLYANADPANLLDPSGRSTLAVYGAISLTRVVLDTAKIVVAGYIAGCGFAFALSAFDVIDNENSVPVIWQWCAKGGKQNIDNEYSGQARLQPDPCSWLAALYQAARAKGDTKTAQKLKTAQKALGCRQHN
jgi:RHS repeat-associated protein